MRRLAALRSYVSAARRAIVNQMAEEWLRELENAAT
jgi:hypothetical protein